MRSGTDLNPRITVAPVEKYKQIVGDEWDGHIRWMPLAELLDGKHYAAKFVDITAAPREFLTLDRRVAH
jgi:hypothetical protein